MRPSYTPDRAGRHEFFASQRDPSSSSPVLRRRRRSPPAQGLAHRTSSPIKFSHTDFSCAAFIPKIRAAPANISAHIKKDSSMSSTPSATNQALDSTLRENRLFPPPPEFSAHAHIQSLEQYEELYKQSIDDPETFWANAANDLHW